MSEKPIEITPELAEQHSIHLFLENHAITNDQGEKLDFRDHPFMWDIYNDWTPKMVAMKAAQVTFSTTATIKSLWLAKNKGMDIIYSLPTSNDVRDFVSGKVNRLINHNPVFQQWTLDKDSIEQKRVGKHNIYYRGTWTERGALMIPADLYIADEVDRSKQDIVSAFSSRLQHSKYAWEWHFSNPSAPGNGADKMWQQSDQKHWFVKCESCGFDWFITMENIMGTPAYFGCTKCKKELNRRRGRWVKRWEDITNISGYWISLLMCPWVSAEKILELKKSKSEQYFSNMVLGQAYVGRGNVITKNLLFQNLVNDINPQEDRPIIGVDTGVDIRYVVGNKRGLYYYGQCSDYSELDKLMQRRQDAIMVIDQGGDIIGPRKLRDRYKGRVFLCFFRPDRNNDELAKWDDDAYTVTADRNKLIQLVVDEFTEKRIPIFGTEAEWYDYWMHWSHIYREEEEDALGVTRYKWMRNDRDDWALATIYWRLGMDRFNKGNADIIMPGGDSIGQRGIEVKPSGVGFLS